MKNLVVITFMLIGSVLTAQDQFTSGMQKAFQLWGEGKTYFAMKRNQETGYPCIMLHR